jgi:hypothetical protein
MGRGMIKERVEGVNSSIIYLLHCKNFCKCHNVTPPRTTRKKETLKDISVCMTPVFTPIRDNEKNESLDYVLFWRRKLKKKEQK